jgi:hypothetical protein
MEVQWGQRKMAERSGVFLLQGGDSLVAMEPGQFASEDDFQRLLSRFPELLVGDQVDPRSPRRWILVKREQPISTGEIGASVWSIGRHSQPRHRIMAYD